MATKVVMAAVGFAVAVVGGGIAVNLATSPTPTHQKVDPASKLVFREQKLHPVTPEMAAAAAELGKKPAPDFDLIDSDGKRHSLADLTADRPLVMFFVELECPCCKGAKTFMDRIQEVYGDQVNVVGVINADREMADAWKRTVVPKFPVLCDPKMATIQAYKAERGVYTTLVAPGGKIVKAYPGYSQKMLKEMGGLIARLVNEPPRPIETKDAPEDLISGCSFPLAK